MKPFLNNDQYYWEDRFFFKFKELKRGNIISFKKNEKLEYTKRIIGLPNEKLIFTSEGKIIVYNQDHPDGAVIKQSYLSEEQAKIPIKLSMPLSFTNRINYIEKYYSQDKLEDIFSDQKSSFKFLQNIPYTIEIPQDSYFVLGDNRKRSFDSRYDIVGLVKKDEIVGKMIR